MVGSDEGVSLLGTMTGDGIFGDAKLLFDDVGFDGDIGKLVTQPLVLYPKFLTLLFPCLDLLLEHDAALDGDVVLLLEVF